MSVSASNQNTAGECAHGSGGFGIADDAVGFGALFHRLNRFSENVPEQQNASVGGHEMLPARLDT